MEIVAQQDRARARTAAKHLMEHMYISAATEDGGKTVPLAFCPKGGRDCGREKPADAMYHVVETAMIVKKLF